MDKVEGRRGEVQGIFRAVKLLSDTIMVSNDIGIYQKPKNHTTQKMKLTVDNGL